MQPKDLIKSKSEQVLEYYLRLDGIAYNEGIKTGKPFNSPLREEKNPSFNVFYDKNQELKWKDFAGDGGDCISYVQKRYNLDFKDAMNKILSEVPGLSNGHTNGTNGIKKSDNTIHEFQTEVKNWDTSELEYWDRYGITQQVLERFNVKSIAKVSFKKGDRDVAIEATPDNPIYTYSRAGFAKVYRPLSPDKKKKFAYLGKIPTPYVFGFEQIPDKGDWVFITAGEKDVMSLSAHGFNAICFNSESAIPDAEIIKKLKSRFKKILVLYDNDETGTKSGQKVSESIEAVNIVLYDLKNGKDISDYFKQGATAVNVKSLVSKAIEHKLKAALDELNESRFDPTDKYEEPPIIISVDECQIATPGNIVTLLGASKSGKSGACGAILAGSLKRAGDIGIDTLGFNILSNPDKKAIIHVDTEQSESDWRKFNYGVLRRAGLDRLKPENHYSWWWKKFSPKERREKFAGHLEIVNETHNGIHLAIIDGIADFVSSPNEETECTELIESWLMLAEKYSFPIIVIIHTNPTVLDKANPKGRGHLGSILERKSETVLHIDRKEDEDISIIRGIRFRNASSREFPLIGYRWDSQKKYHAYVGVMKEDDELIDTELIELVDECFKEKASIKFGELVKAVMAISGVKERQAKRHVQKMVDSGLIQKENTSRFSPYIKRPQSDLPANYTQIQDDEVPF